MRRVLKLDWKNALSRIEPGPTVSQVEPFGCANRQLEMRNLLGLDHRFELQELILVPWLDAFDLCLGGCGLSATKRHARTYLA